MKNEDLDTLEDFDTIDDTFDVLEAMDPDTAMVELIVEELICNPIRDFLEKY